MDPVLFGSSGARSFVSPPWPSLRGRHSYAKLGKKKIFTLPFRRLGSTTNISLCSNSWSLIGRMQALFSKPSQIPSHYICCSFLSLSVHSAYPDPLATITACFCVASPPPQSLSILAVAPLSARHPNLALPYISRDARLFSNLTRPSLPGSISLLPTRTCLV